MSVLREVPGTRRVVRTRIGAMDCVTRVLLTDRLPRHQSELIRHLVLDGTASLAGLPESVLLTIEGYRVAATTLGREDPNWTHAVDAGVDENGHAFVTTKWIEGTPLHELDLATLSDAERCGIAMDVLAILARLHDRRVAYGDLKPQNLVRTPEGTITLIDLDTVRRVPSGALGAIARDLTPRWAAPEQSSRFEVWLASDLWAWEQLVRFLFPKGPPPAWTKGLAACRRRAPLDRPETSSLLKHFEETDAPILTFGGRVVEEGAESNEPPPPAMPTERVEVLRADTQRVADVTGKTEKTRSMAANYLRDQPGCLGWLSGLTRGALVAVAMAGLLGFGLWTWWGIRVRELADARADRTMAALKIHKTDPAQNGRSERLRLATEAEAAWTTAETGRTCAVRALANVWQQGWHFAGTWNPGVFAEGRALVENPLCADEPETLLAAGTLYAGACVRKLDGVPSPEDCSRAIEALARFGDELPRSTDTHWLRLEGAWQEVRARKALAGRYLQTANAEAAPMLAAAQSLCAGAHAELLAWAPVNGVEMMEDCLAVAALAEDVPNFLLFADAVLASGLPTDRKDRGKKFLQFYAAGGPACADAGLRWRGGWSASGPAWCVALGHAARHCGAAALAVIARDAPADPDHPWEALHTAVSDAGWPAAACVQ